VRTRAARIRFITAPTAVGIIAKLVFVIKPELNVAATTSDANARSRLVSSYVK